MRVNAATNATASAWPSNGRVQIRVGVHRYTANLDEAIELAQQLTAAADTLRHPNIIPFRKAPHAS